MESLRVASRNSETDTPVSVSIGIAICRKTPPIGRRCFFMPTPRYTAEEGRARDL